MLAGVSYTHLEQPVKAVGGDTAEARTSADLAASMLQSITQRKRYGQSNPATAKLSEAAKVMRAGVSKLPDGASPLQQAAAAAAAAERMAQQEFAAAEQRQAAAAAAAEAFPQPNERQRAEAAAADAAAAAKAQESRRTTRGAEQQQQPDEQQQQQLAPCGWSVHYLNAFILQQLFSGVVERSLTTRRGQVFDSILLLMGLAGELAAADRRAAEVTELCEHAAMSAT
jgi:flagellar biosynthesis GTPase FlhF